MEPVLDALTTVAEAHPAFFTPTVLTTLVPLLQSLCALPLGLAASLPDALRCTPLPEEEGDFDKSYARLTAALNLLVTLFHRVKKAALTRSGAFTVGIQLVPVLLGWLAIGISPYDLESQEERDATQAWIERDDVSLSLYDCHQLIPGARRKKRTTSTQRCPNTASMHSLQYSVSRRRAL